MKVVPRTFVFLGGHFLFTCSDICCTSIV